MLKIESRGKTALQSPPSPFETVFRSTGAALKFALNFSHGTLQKSFLAKAMGAPGASSGLAGLDGAAQAGMILAELQRLATLRRCLLTGRYTQPSSPCACRAACCRGWRENPEWKQAIDYLTEYVLVAGLTGAISHLHLRRVLVVRYFEVRVSLIDTANACGVHRNTASQYNKKVVEHFRGEERPAFHELDGQLKGRGVVES